MIVAPKLPTNYEKKPLIVAVGGTRYTYGDGTTWYGPYEYGYGVQTSSRMNGLPTNSRNKWLGVGTEGDRNSKSLVLTSPERFSFEQMSGLSVEIASGAYNNYEDEWLAIREDGNVANQTVYKSTDNGETWNNLGENLPWFVYVDSGRNVAALTRPTRATIYVATGDRLIITHDTGESWILAAGQFPDSRASSLAYNPLEDKFYVSIEGSSSFSGVASQDRTDLNSNWTSEVAASSTFNCWGIDSNYFTGTMCAVRSGGQVIRKELGGTWGGVQTIGSGSAYHLSYSPEIDKWFLIIGSALWTSVDDGASWTQDTSFPSNLGSNIRIDHKHRYTMYVIES